VQRHLKSSTNGRIVQVAIVVEPRFLKHAQPKGLAAALNARGHDVSIIPLEQDTMDTARSRLKASDVAVARGRSPEMLELLTWCGNHGINVVDGAWSISSVLNKATMASALHNAGLPVPASRLVSTDKLAEELAETRLPIIIKPIFGDNSRGVRLIESLADLERVRSMGRFALAQEFVEGDGYELKLYAIGDQVWAIRKGSTISRVPGNGRTRATQVPVTSDMEELAHKCGRVFGLRMFGVDCIITDAGPVIIEVNDFPNYSGVPEAARRLADLVLEHAGSPVANSTTSSGELVRLP
jgi:ribosomal protein S6--L-glutamate ligase